MITFKPDSVVTIYEKSRGLLDNLAIRKNLHYLKHQHVYKGQLLPGTFRNFYLNTTLKTSALDNQKTVKKGITGRCVAPYRER